MLNNRFKELAAQAWAEHPGASEEEFLEYYGRLIVDDCASCLLYTSPSPRD